AMPRRLAMPWESTRGFLRAASPRPTICRACSASSRAAACESPVNRPKKISWSRIGTLASKSASCGKIDSRPHSFEMLSTLMPSTSIHPRSGFRNPAAREKSVVLPAPLGPTRPKIELPGISNDTRSRATVRPKALVKSWMRTAAAPFGGGLATMAAESSCVMISSPNASQVAPLKMSHAQGQEHHREQEHHHHRHAEHHRVVVQEIEFQRPGSDVANVLQIFIEAGGEVHKHNRK